MVTNLVSVITPMYKGAAFVGETIESVLAQTYPHWEMIIVDDCSPDGGAGIRVVEKYAEKDNRIKLIASPVNRGSSGARNIALREAKGRYIAFIDSDDMWYPRYLESQLAFMEKTEAVFVFASIDWVDENGRTLLNTFKVPAKVGYKDILKSNPISMLTTFYDRESVGEQYFREELKSVRDDYAFMLEILKKTGYACGNSEVLAAARIVPGSATYNKRKVIKPQFMIYYQVEKLGLPRSIYYLSNWVIRSIFKFRKVLFK